MQIGRVIGDLSATQKHVSHEGKTMLLVQPLGLDGSPAGNPVVAVDGVKAGVGDRVLLVYDGFAAFTAAGLTQAPLDTAVIGVIDRVELFLDASARVPDAPARVSDALDPAGGVAPPKQQHKQKTP
jgi:ethanolamine utilization protein EutN